MLTLFLLHSCIFPLILWVTLKVISHDYFVCSLRILHWLRFSVLFLCFKIFLVFSFLLWAIILFIIAIIPFFKVFILFFVLFCRWHGLLYRSVWLINSQFVWFRLQRIVNYPNLFPLPSFFTEFNLGTHIFSPPPPLIIHLFFFPFYKLNKILPPHRTCSIQAIPYSSSFWKDDLFFIHILPSFSFGKEQKKNSFFKQTHTLCFGMVF